MSTPTIPLASALGLAALTLSTFVAITTELLPVGLLPQMSREFGVEEGTMGLIVTIYALVVTVLAIPLTALTTKLPRKSLLIATLLGYGVSNLIVAIAPTFAILCVGRAVGGLAHALFFSVASAYASKLVPKHLVGRAIAITFAGSSMGLVLGVPLATSVGSAVGWRTAFWALVGIAALLVLVTASLLPSVSGDGTSHNGNPRAWRRSGLIWVGAANSIMFLGHYTAYTYVSAILRFAGVQEAAVGSILLLLGGTGIIGLWAAGMVIDRAPRVGLLVTASIMVLSLIGLSFTNGAMIPTIIAVGFWCMAFGAAPTFMMTAAIRTGAVSPDIAGAVVNGSSNLGIGLGAAVGAQFFAASGAMILGPVAAIIVAGSLVVIACSRRGFPTRPHRENLGTGSMSLSRPAAH
ncbi:MAG: transporter [Glaciihabitans sp.]|nr:transporter [Glaciihabitans sp.]